MKKKILAALTASLMLCSILTAPAAADTAEDKSVETNLSYFFELSLDEIEERMNADTTQRDTGSVSIALSISKAQIQKQLTDLAPQKEAIEAWQISFKKAYFDLLLEKLHLTGIYDAADPEYLNTDLPSAWIDETDPFTIVESDHDESALCWVKLGYGKDVLLEYNDETITMTPYEAAERSLYVIRTYGDKDYYTSARDDLRGKYIGTDIAGVAGDANCDGFCDVSDAVLIARFVNEDREAVFTDKGKLNADVMHDGNIDGQDAEKILQYIAKKIGYDEFAAGIDPYIVPIDFSVPGMGVPEQP